MAVFTEPERAQRSTQRSRALALLRKYLSGVCVTVVASEHPYDVLTFRNRISELTRDGFPIIARVCKEHHHRGSVMRYSLSGAPMQMDLLPPRP